MQGRSLFVILVGCLFFLGGCVTTPEPLTEAEIRNLDAVYDTFEKHDMKILSKLSSDKKVIAAQQKVKKCEPKVQKHDHKHDAPCAIDNKFIIVGKAMADASGEYQQPVFSMGERVFFYKILYTATFEDKFIRVTKTTGTEESPLRSDAVVEPDILQEIATQIGGKVQDNGVAW